VEDLLSVLMPLKGFEEKITLGGVLGMMQCFEKTHSVVIKIGTSSSYVELYQFLHRIHMLTQNLNVEFVLNPPDEYITNPDGQCYHCLINCNVNRPL